MFAPADKASLYARTSFRMRQAGINKGETILRGVPASSLRCAAQNSTVSFIKQAGAAPLNRNASASVAPLSHACRREKQRDALQASTFLNLVTLTGTFLYRHTPTGGSCVMSRSARMSRDLFREKENTVQFRRPGMFALMAFLFFFLSSRGARLVRRLWPHSISSSKLLPVIDALSHSGTGS